MNSNFKLTLLSAHFVPVELETGPTAYSGILTLYNDKLQEFGAICMHNFGPNEISEYLSFIV